MPVPKCRWSDFQYSFKPNYNLIINPLFEISAVFSQKANSNIQTKK